MTAISRALAPSARALRLAWRWVSPIVAAISSLGWTVIAIGVIAFELGRRLHWIEAMYVAAACLGVVVVCGLLTIGRTHVRVDLAVDPRRVTVGKPAAGRVVVTNLSRRPLLPIALELPIGIDAARFELPALGSGSEHEELVVIPTNRRGVIDVGPATTVRGDPFGVFGRKVPWTEVLQLFVHPRTVPVESFGTGLLRDLEGQATNDMSMSDLAFHALREYVPGDDRRFIHWRSSAKVGAGQPGGRFLVRQFLDTRRSHIAIVVDSRLASYADEDGFETAISVAASLARQAGNDGIDLTLAVGRATAHKPPLQSVLDIYARAQASGDTLGAAALDCARNAPETSLAMLVTGPAVELPELQLAATQFPPEALQVCLRINPSAPASSYQIGSLSLLTVPTLDDLSVMMARGAW